MPSIAEILSHRKQKEILSSRPEYPLEVEAKTTYEKGFSKMPIGILLTSCDRWFCTSYTRRLSFCSKNSFTGSAVKSTKYQSHLKATPDAYTAKNEAKTFQRPTKFLFVTYWTTGSNSLLSQFYPFVWFVQVLVVRSTIFAWNCLKIGSITWPTMHTNRKPGYNTTKTMTVHTHTANKQPVMSSTTFSPSIRWRNWKRICWQM